jgi:hypothetical protein
MLVLLASTGAFARKNGTIDLPDATFFLTALQPSRYPPHVPCENAISDRCQRVCTRAG